MAIIIYFPIVVSLFAIVFVFFLGKKISKAPVAKQKLLQVLKVAQEKSMSYAKKQYGALAVAVAALFFLMLIFMGLPVAFGFLIGAFVAAALKDIQVLASFWIASRVLEAPSKRKILAQSELKKITLLPADILLDGSFAMGVLASSLALLCLSGYYFLTDGNVYALAALAGGAGFVALFTRVSGKIYSKTETTGIFVGAWHSIFETYLVATVLLMMLGWLLYPKSPQFILLPLFLASILLLSQILAGFFIKIKTSKNGIGPLQYFLVISTALSLIGFYIVIKNIMAGQIITTNSLFFSCLAGFAVLAALFVSVKFQIFKKFHRLILLFAGLILGACALSFGFWLAGAYGLALVAFCMLLPCAVLIAQESFLMIATYNADVAKVSHASMQVIKNTQSLRALALAPGQMVRRYDLIAFTMVAIILFAGYHQRIVDVTGSQHALTPLILNPRTIIGFLAGAMLSYMIALLFTKAAKRASINPTLKTAIAIREATIIATGIILVPVMFGFLLGAAGLEGLLLGMMVEGFFLGMVKPKSRPVWNFIKKRTGLIKMFKDGTGIGIDSLDQDSDIAIYPAIGMLGIVALLIAVFLV